METILELCMQHRSVQINRLVWLEACLAAGMGQWACSRRKLTIFGCALVVVD